MLLKVIIFVLKKEMVERASEIKITLLRCQAFLWTQHYIFLLFVTVKVQKGKRFQNTFILSYQNISNRTYVSSAYDKSLNVLLRA